MFHSAFWSVPRAAACAVAAIVLAFTALLSGCGDANDARVAAGNAQDKDPVYSPVVPAPPKGSGQTGGETYNRIVDNPWLVAERNPLSTFSIAVDTASYSNIRRFLLQNKTMPPADA